jgi:hypothetical protein
MKIPLVISTIIPYDLLNTSYKFHLHVNECLSNSTCDANATCNNTEGSYTCTCDSGYSGDGISCDGMHCTKVIIITRNTCMQQTFAYISQTLNLHKVFRNGQHWTKARVQVLPWQHEIFQFFYIFCTKRQNTKIVERFVHLTIQQWISEIFTVGMLFYILRVLIKCKI